jgi:hypothetical protein
LKLTNLGLTPAALASVRAIGIVSKDELLATPAEELIARGIDPPELYEIACRVAERGLCLGTERAASPGDLAVLHLRIIEALSLREVAKRLGISPERVRGVLLLSFGLTGKAPVREDVTEERKRCVQCGEDRQLSEFHRDRSQPDGRHRWCKRCRSARYVYKGGKRAKARALQERIEALQRGGALPIDPADARLLASLLDYYIDNI